MTTPQVLAHDDAGVTVVEFALIAPVLVLSLLGVFDLGHTMYTNALLHGAIQKAARDSTIEAAGDNEAVIDARVRAIVHDIAPGATFSFNRRSYTNFSDVGRPEDFTDVNANDTCDNNEPFEDANGNGLWDSSASGSSGFGGARDAVLLTVTVEYDRFFPVARFLGQSDTNRLVASTVLRNQPYGLQAEPAVENCT